MPAALVLGAAVRPDGSPSPALCRRTAHAIALFHAGKVGAIIGCGGPGDHAPTEAEAIRRICRASGLPDAMVHLEDRSANTAGNLRNARPILDRLGIAGAVIVTDRYHAPRARLAARRLGLCATLSCPAPAGAPRLRLLKSRLRELPAWLWYFLTLRG
ncbi:YdcF family protein [Pukyongiella litopenaei]|uniref:YdcF family protein n=1 Tax=Pukyongiella litopenaei TaxID=2605946 RepID=A0A2S0MVF5_9RHOB|nr:YdcF family protein [Pukyongiella litopenaei]AVO39701.1 YdcF family protein [Pukyongiella litopenaei]